MRNYDADVAAELAKEVLQFYTLLELQLSETTYRWTDRDVSVFWEENRYYPLGFKFDSIALGSSMTVDEVGITVDNISRYFSGILLNEDCRNRPLIISFGVRRKISDITGSVALPNIRLSLADGFAFVDFTGNTSFQDRTEGPSFQDRTGVTWNKDNQKVLTDNIGAKLTITDSAGKKATGYIKTVGTGETYSELITNGGFDSDTTGWIPLYCTLASVAGGDSGNCLEITRTSAAFQSAGQLLNADSGALLIGSAKVKSGTAGDTAARLWASTNSENITLASATSSGAWTELSGKATAPANIISFSLLKYNLTAGTMLFDTASLQQVLTPAATGVTIVSEKGGSEQNWASIEDGFNYNDASGYTYTIEPLKEEELVETLFTGFLAGWDIEGDSSVHIKVANEFILWNKKTLRKHAALCPWAFRGAECGYAGAEAKVLCDKTYDTCASLYNESRFGGHRWIPIIAEREDWWGRTRG